MKKLSLPGDEPIALTFGEGKEQLSAQLQGALQLQEISATLIREQEPTALYQKIVEAAIQLMRSDMASMQEYVPARRQLRLLAHRGFHPQSAKFWQWVDADSGSPCGKALLVGARSIVDNVDTCDFIVTSKDLPAFRRSDIRAVQSTPLIARDGRIIGMISTHWRYPHAPSADDFALFDTLVRQAADLVERAQIYEALRDAKAEAEVAKDEAVRANEAKTRFFAAASHDLRQPFQAMRLFFEVIRESSNDKQLPAVDRLGQSMATAEEMLNDLLDVARLDSGVIAPNPTVADLISVIDRVRCELEPLASRKNLTFKTRCGPISAYVDGAILARILFNIASNAIKYTNSGGVLIGVRRRGSRVVVEVWDTGIGIAEDQVGRVFEDFYQIGNPHRGSGKGVGLGLAIVKRLSQLMDCQVTFSSRLGKGSVFRISLPSFTPG